MLDVGRLWSEHDNPVECPDGNPWVEYVRAEPSGDVGDEKLLEAVTALENNRGMQYGQFEDEITLVCRALRAHLQRTSEFRRQMEYQTHLRRFNQITLGL